uniref:Uncharacterized protein n=1 Tax=Oryza brachyantha TaxID=4533 RepID=J3MLB5_ORYBR
MARVIAKCRTAYSSVIFPLIFHYAIRISHGAGPSLAGVLQKIFLDTTRLIAGKTNNLLEELWKYIEDGKLLKSAVLLLAAHKQIRGTVA